MILQLINMFMFVSTIVFLGSYFHCTLRVILLPYRFSAITTFKLTNVLITTYKMLINQKILVPYLVLIMFEVLSIQLKKYS